MRCNKFALCSYWLFTLCIGFPSADAVASPSCTATVPETTPTTDFVVHGDGTVSHAKTGLMWKQCAEGQSGMLCATGSPTPMTWERALQAANLANSGIGFANQTDWRLPNRKELESIVERCGFFPAINKTVFPATPLRYQVTQVDVSPFWTSSSLPNSPTSAFVTDFDEGNIRSSIKTNLNFARLVRGGQSIDVFDRITHVHSVTYNGNGNTAGSVPIDSTAYVPSATVTVLANTGHLTRAGYAFSGWNTRADLTGSSYAASGSDAFSMGSSNVTLFAMWSPISVNDGYVPIITEFSAGISGGVSPAAITIGFDGNMWFTEPPLKLIGRITPAGTITEFNAGTMLGVPNAITVGPSSMFVAGPLLWFTSTYEEQVMIGYLKGNGTALHYFIPALKGPTAGIAKGPDGNVWFTAPNANFIGRILAGVLSINQFKTGIRAGAGLQGIAAGPDGNLWFTERAGNQIGRITLAGVVTEFGSGISPGAGLQGITAGPDGNLWFTESEGNRIGRITPTGVVTEFSAGISPGSGPHEITSGPDGNLWFTERAGNRIARITPTGTVTEFSAGISPGSGPQGIAAGPDGNIWFTESTGGRIGRVTLGPNPDGCVATINGGASTTIPVSGGAVNLAVVGCPSTPGSTYSWSRNGISNVNSGASWTDILAANQGTTSLTITYQVQVCNGVTCTVLPAAPLTARVSAPPPGSVIEFYNTGLNHFFLTANAAEAASIDSGGSGPGWTRTGNTFRSGGPNAVCRFYGVQAAGGPNGHFYTAEPNECEVVKLDPGWRFESLDFAITPVTPGGSCPAGLVNVYRAYNGRFAQHDSNHRITANFEDYQAQVSAGWHGEGVVMCAQP